MNKMKAFIKYIFSFRKSKWDINDYPLRFKHQKSEQKKMGRLELVPWTVQIINWWQIGGIGNTKEEAFLDLKKKLNCMIENGEKLPRPGSGLPIEFATTEGIEKYSELVDEFLEKICGFTEDESVIVTDETSLWELHFEEIDEPIIQKIKEVYNVDVSDIKNRNLFKILERISTHNYR